MLAVSDKKSRSPARIIKRYRSANYFVRINSILERDERQICSYFLLFFSLHGKEIVIHVRFHVGVLSVIRNRNSL